MSDELYFGPPPRKHRSSDHPYFSDPREEEYEQHGPLEGESLNEHPHRHPLNVENIRRMMRERNPHGE